MAKVYDSHHRNDIKLLKTHMYAQQQGTRNSSLGRVIFPTWWHFHPLTRVKQYPVEKVTLPKLLYRGSLNWQGNSVHCHWSSRPTDKGELIKNKNLIKLVLNQQQLKGIHEACKTDFFSHISWSSHMRLIKEQLERKNHGWHWSGWGLFILHILHRPRCPVMSTYWCDIPLVTVTDFTLKCASFWEWAAIAILGWTLGSPRLSSHDA